MGALAVAFQMSFVGASTVLVPAMHMAASAVTAR
jgi:hypothetical protein